MRKEMTAAGATPIILALLREQEDYGYSLIRRLRGCSGELFDWAEGMLYPILHRLERQGYLSSRFIPLAGEPGGSGRRRKYYAATESGTAYFDELLGEWEKIYEIIGKIRERDESGEGLSAGN